MNPLSFMDGLGRQVWAERKTLAGPLWLILAVSIFSSLLSGVVGLLFPPGLDPANPDMTGAAITYLLLLLTVPLMYVGTIWLGLCLTAGLEGEPMPPWTAALKGRYVGAILLSIAFVGLALVVATPGLILVGFGYILTAMLTLAIAMAMSGLLLASTMRGETLAEAIRIVTQPKHLGLQWGMGHWKTYLLMGLAMFGVVYGLTSVTQIATFVFAFVSAFQAGIGNPEAYADMTRNMQLAGLISAPMSAAAYTMSSAVYIGGSVWLARLLEGQREGAAMAARLNRLEGAA